MGFRRTITTATDVDTGTPTGAGVKVYETSDANGNQFGVVEFRDGLFGDAPAQVMGKAFLSSRGAVATGGGLSLVAGSYNGTTGPELDLSVESDPAGGYRPVARLLHADLAPQATAFVSTWLAGFRDWPTGQERPQFTHHADGLVTFTGLAQNNSGATRGGVGTSTQIATIPAGFVPPVTAIRTALANGSVNCRVDFSSDGHLYLTDCPVIPVGSQLVFGVAYRLDATASA
jgi:hypothetical protein